LRFNHAQSKAYKPKAGLSNKRSCLAPALGANKVIVGFWSRFVVPLKSVLDDRQTYYLRPTSKWMFKLRFYLLCSYRQAFTVCDLAFSMHNVKLWEKIVSHITLLSMGLYHKLDGIANLKYKLLYFLTPIKKIPRERH
jgi:hypothetical protein